jgi:hypothetical protein
MVFIAGGLRRVATTTHLNPGSSQTEEGTTTAGRASSRHGGGDSPPTRRGSGETVDRAETNRFHQTNEIFNQQASQIEALTPALYGELASRTLDSFTQENLPALFVVPPHLKQAYEQQKAKDSSSAE